MSGNYLAVGEHTLYPFFLIFLSLNVHYDIAFISLTIY